MLTAGIAPNDRGLSLTSLNLDLWCTRQACYQRDIKERFLFSIMEEAIVFSCTAECPYQWSLGLLQIESLAYVCHNCGKVYAICNRGHYRYRKMYLSLPFLKSTFQEIESFTTVKLVDELLDIGFTFLKYGFFFCNALLMVSM